MSVQPVIGVGTIGTDSGLASVVADLRRRLSQVEAVRTSIGDGALTGTQIAAGTIVSGNIAAGSIIAANIAAGTITSEYIAAGAITTGLLAAGAVTADKITAGTITSDRIQAGAITATLIAADAIQAGAIQAGAVTADKIAAGAVTSDKITVTDLSAITSSLGNITAGLITGATFRTAGSGSRVVIDSAGLRGYGLDGVTKIFEIDAGSGIARFTGVANIDATSVIPGGAIVDGSIGAAEIAAGSIHANHIAAGAIDATSLNIQFSGPNIVKNSGFEYGRYDSGIYSTELNEWSQVDGNAEVVTSEAWEGSRSVMLTRQATTKTALDGPVTATLGIRETAHGPGTYTYKVTAVKGGVELTPASSSVTVALERLTDILASSVTVTSTTAGAGTNHGGQRYYAVTAIGSNGGETTTTDTELIDVFGQRKNILPPVGFSAVCGSRGTGGLPGGEYEYALVTLGADGETTPSFTAPSVPITRLATPAAPTYTSHPATGTGLYASDWKFWLVALDRNGQVDPYSGPGRTGAGSPLSITLTGDDEVQIQWSPTANTYAAAYMIYYQDVTGGTDLYSIGPFSDNTINSFRFTTWDGGTDSASNHWDQGYIGSDLSLLPSENTSVEYAYSIQFLWTTQTGAGNQRLYSFSASPGGSNPDGTSYLQTRLIGNTGSYTYTGSTGWTGGTTPPVVNTTDLGGTTYNFSFPRQDGALRYRVYLVDADNETTQIGKYFEVPQPASGSMVNFTDYGTQTHYSIPSTYPATNTSEVWRAINVDYTKLDASYGVDSYRIYRGTEGRIAERAATAAATFVDHDYNTTPNVSQQPPTTSAGFMGGMGNVVIANSYGTEYRVYPDSDYVLSGYFKADSGAVGSRMYVAADFYAEDFSYLGSMAAEGALTTEWTRVWGRGHSPVGTHHISLFVGADGIASGQAVYADGIQVEKSQVVSEYAPRWDDYVPGSIGPTSLTPNSITTEQIMANSIQADRLFVSSLSAISADLGTITAGSINGTTITGALIRTAGSNQRIELDASSMRFYDASGTQQLTAFGSGLHTSTGFASQKLIFDNQGLRGFNASGTQQFQLSTDGTMNLIRNGGAWGSILMKEGSVGGATTGAISFAPYYTDLNATTIRAFTSAGRTKSQSELLAVPGDWVGGADARFSNVNAYWDAGAYGITSASSGTHARTLVNSNGQSAFIQNGGAAGNLPVGRCQVWRAGSAGMAPLLNGQFQDVTYTFPDLNIAGMSWWAICTLVNGLAALSYYIIGYGGNTVTMRYHNVGPNCGSYAVTAFLLTDY